MKHKDFDALLEKIQAEIQRMDRVDAESEKRLRELESDIRTLLERDDASENDSILQRMNRYIEQFEMKYPALTTLLSELSSILNNAGI